MRHWQAQKGLKMLNCWWVICSSTNPFFYFYFSHSHGICWLPRYLVAHFFIFSFFVCMKIIQAIFPWKHLIFKIILPLFDLDSFSVSLLFVCLFRYLSCGSSEDDDYVNKLPTFERHFDSFAGIVKIPSERTRDGAGWGWGSVSVWLLNLCDAHYPECIGQKGKGHRWECFCVFSPNASHVQSKV